jgi:fusaric acid resistance family protein
LNPEFAEDAFGSVLCLPAIAVLLVAGIASGHAGGAVVAASGAISVGFGAFQRFTRSKSAPMLLAALGMAISAVCGSLLGEHWHALVMAAAVWAGVCAWALAFGMGPWWIALQWAIALFVAGAYPSGLNGALLRGSLVLAGGALQFAAVELAWRLERLEAGGHPLRVRTYLRYGRQQLPASFALVGYALRAAAAAAFCVTLSRSLEMPNGYWAPMTALLVIRPTLRETVSRGVARGIGTLIGAGVATLVAALLRPGPYLTAALVVVFAWGAYATRRVHYAALTTSITACIVFLLALFGLPEPANAVHRIFATLVGGATALALAALAGAASFVHARARRSTSQ